MTYTMSQTHQRPTGGHCKTRVKEGGEGSGEDGQLVDAAGPHGPLPCHQLSRLSFLPNRPFHSCQQSGSSAFSLGGL